MGLQPVEIAALASTGLAAVAATASWANVIQTNSARKSARLPELHVTAGRYDPVGPIYGLGSNITTVEFTLYNAGGGIAKGASYVLQFGSEYVIGFAAAILRAGEACQIKTDIDPAALGDRSWSGVASCLDHKNHRRTWKLPGTTPTVDKGESNEVTLQDLFEQTYPDVKLSDLSRRKGTVKLLTS